MSTRQTTYALRSTRARPAPAAGHPGSELQAASPRDSPLFTERSLSPTTETTPQRRYSDVVASRPPTPVRVTVDRETVKPSGRDPGQDSVKDSSHVVDTPLSNKNPFIERNTNLSDNSEDEDPGEWQTVPPRRRARSLEAAVKPTKKPVTVRIQSPVRQTDVSAAISQAEHALTEAQKEHIARRNERVCAVTPERSESRQEGPSRLKGKGVDPREWGNAQLPDEELDVDAQRVAFEQFEHHRKDRGKRAERPARVSHSREPSVHKRSSSHRAESAPLQPRYKQMASSNNVLPEESRPQAMINPKSYLGLAMQKLGKSAGRGKLPDDGDDDSSSSSSSSSESSSHSESSLSEGNGSSNRRRRRSRRSRRKESSNKAFKPTVYDGRVDTRAFFRFMRESEAYLEDSKIKRKRRAFALSYFLKGKAYDFYLQKVAMTEETFTVQRFFAELYDYIFPIDYILEMQNKYLNARQSGKSISEYSHELEELANVIGTIQERDLVIKFWTTTRNSIQEALWRDGLHPQRASWEEVVARAEIVEISERVGHRSQPRSNFGSQQSSNGSNHGRHHGRSSGTPAPANTSFTPQSRVHRSFGSGGRGGFAPRGGRPSPRHFDRGSSSRPSDNRERSKPTFSRDKSAKPSHREPSKTPQRFSKEPGDGKSSDSMRCFTCNEPGHLARNCPQGSSVKHSGNRPPGFSTFSLEPVEDNSDEPVEVLDSLPLGAVSFDLAPEGNCDQGVTEPMIVDENIIPYPRKRFGDAFADRAVKLLSGNQPYPGDECYTNPFAPPHRFAMCKRGRRESYLIFDHLTGFKIVIPIKLMLIKQFNIVGWYIKRRAKALRMPRTNHEKIWFGDALCESATLALEEGIYSSYPPCQPDHSRWGRFSVFPDSLDAVPTGYTIYDADLDRETPISRELLLNPGFDIIGWYRDYITRSGIFESAYTQFLPSNDLWDSSIEPLNQEWFDELLDPDFDGLGSGVMGDIYSRRVQFVLERCQPYPGDTSSWLNHTPSGQPRFDIDTGVTNNGLYIIFDRKRGTEYCITSLFCKKSEFIYPGSQAQKV